MELKCTENSVKRLVFFKPPSSPERLQKVAKEQLGETEELKKECLRQLRRLIKDHGVICITRDEFLLRFLRTKKFNVQRSFEALRTYAHRRASFQEHLLKLQPEVLRTCLRHNIFSFLQDRDNADSLVFCLLQEIWNPSICSEDDMATILILMLNYAAEEQSSQVSGLVAIHDKCIPLMHLPYFMKNARFVLTFLFNCLPIRYKNVHCINDPFLLRYVLRILNPFFPKKIKDRILFHGNDRELLFQHLQPDILPNDFGGNLGPLNNDHLTEVMIDYLQKMKDEQKYFLPQE